MCAAASRIGKSRAAIAEQIRALIRLFFCCLSYAIAASSLRLHLSATTVSASQILHHALACSFFLLSAPAFTQTHIAMPLVAIFALLFFACAFRFHHCREKSVKFVNAKSQLSSAHLCHRSAYLEMHTKLPVASLVYCFGLAEYKRASRVKLASSRFLPSVESCAFTFALFCSPALLGFASHRHRCHASLGSFVLCVRKVNNSRRWCIKLCL